MQKYSPKRLLARCLGAVGLAVLCAACGSAARDPAKQTRPASEPWEGHATDGGVLRDVADEIDIHWPGFPSLPSSRMGDNATVAVAAGDASVGFLGGDYPNVPKSCVNTKSCEIPVVIRESAGHCFAVLPFIRFPVVWPRLGTQPETLHFVLAKWDEVQKVWTKRDAKDNYRFNTSEIAPLFGGKKGVFIHELHSGPPGVKHRRVDMSGSCGSSYFCDQRIDTKGLVATWTVGDRRTWRPPANSLGNFIGRVYGGVAAAALVINDNPNRKTRFCKPVDPIIVNVAN